MSTSPSLSPAQPSSASMTQLPPSPEIGAVQQMMGGGVPEFPLDGSSSSQVVKSTASASSPSTDPPPFRRLLSVARYQAFHPQALACSNTLTSSSNDEEPTPSSFKSPHHPSSHPSSSSTPKDPGPSSLGAVAGPQGVALFRLSRPHVPLLILSHATNSTTATSSISSLAFQPDTPNNSIGPTSRSSLYLAAARGSGVLLWDASGHNPSPLIGRLGMDQAHNNNGSTPSLDYSDTRITSIAWKPSQNPLLATTTSFSLSLWDLRSGASFKPSLRFGTARAKTFAGTSPLVQVACASDSNGCATMDASGIVRVYDIRMTERGTRSPVSTIAAHESAGVGISYIGNTSPTQNDSNSSRWLTWGLDSPLGSAVVKVWSNEPKVSTTLEDPDEYWYMGNIEKSSDLTDSPRHSKMIASITASTTNNSSGEYHLKAFCARPNLACARVCSSPVENTFLAVGHCKDGSDNHNDVGVSQGRGWWAELFTLTNNTKKGADAMQRSNSTLFGLERVAGFQGGAATSSWDRKALLSILGGRVDLGRLQAAELAFSGASYRPRSILSSSDETEKPQQLQEEERNNGVDLLLCCLSDTGVVTTHVIPEATPRQLVNRSFDIGKRDHSPKRAGARSSLVRTAFPASINQARVYPEDKEGAALMDAAAGFWGGITSSSTHHHTGGELAINRGGDEARFSSDPHAQSPQTPDAEVGANGRSGEGGIMPFDMDVPVAYGSVTAGNMATIQLGITDITSGSLVSKVEEVDPVSVGRDSTSIMENIETERVPCPRLCGATFGSGNGGLVIFHNGEVRKMWSWYQRTDNIRFSGVPGGKGDIASDPDNLRMVHNTRTSHPLSSEVDGSTKQNEPAASSLPRTLKELINMITTSKEAQWGERNGSDGSDSDDAISIGDNFFEDESLGSNSSDSEEDVALTPPPTDDMHMRYFGSRAWKGTLEKVEQPGSTSRTQSTESPRSSRKIKAFVGPSSDMLAPVVGVTHDFDAIMLNHQSISLAKGWELGGWDFNIFDSFDSYRTNEGRVVEQKDGKTDSSFESLLLSQSRGLPHYRYLSSSPSIKGRMPRPRSDPSMAKADSKSTSKRYNAPHDEPGVHGGEYSIRPNMEESMTFLKKLFTHQQEGGAGFPATLLSPPDSPLLLNNLSISKRPSPTGQMLPFQTADTAFQSNPLPRRNIEIPSDRVLELGVYTICQQKKSDCNDFQELENIKRICLHNASVCETFGETEKEGVWKLFAQIVDDQMDDEDKTFNGWGGNGGGALGVDLVSSLLRYYECLGDVQMLATIFCVLSGGHRSTRRAGQTYLLPQGQDEKYDAYIRKYAELLYSWGLLSIRAELNKHLIRIPSTREGDLSTEEKSEAGRSPGFAVVFLCPRCGQDADTNANMCRNCQDYAFRCSICDNAVRGLFTVCDVCNHGGHVQHMTLWFSNNIACPTGCGCNCTFSPMTQASVEASA